MDRKVIIKKGENKRNVGFDDILYVEEEIKYSRVYHLGESKVVTMYYYLDAMEAILNNELFFRCHPTFLVNILHIKRIYKTSLGVHRILLVNGAKIKLDKDRREQLIEYMCEKLNITII